MKSIGEKRLIFLLAGISLVLLVAMCVVLALTGKPSAPPFEPPEFDPSALKGTPTVSEDLGWSEIYKQGMSFRASLCGELRIQNNTAKIYFTNPEENTLWLKLRILNEKGEVLGETGLIRPGEYLPEITFQVLPNDGEKLNLKLMSYQPGTYYSGGSVTVTTVAQLEGEV